jgi:hypothetical protein
MVAYTKTVRVPYTVTECVPTVVCKKVKTQVCEDVCVKKLRCVPVTVTEECAPKPACPPVCECKPCPKAECNPCETKCGCDGFVKRLLGRLHADCGNPCDDPCAAPAAAAPAPK